MIEQSTEEEAKCEFYQSQSLDDREDPKKAWSRWSKLLGRGHSDSLPNNTGSDTDTAEKFADFFLSKIAMIRSRFDDAASVSA